MNSRMLILDWMSTLWKYLGDWCELKPSGSFAQWVYLSLYLSPQSAQCGVARWRLGTITRTSAWLCQYLQSQLAPTAQQHHNNQTIFWRHQYRKHQSDIVLCSTACTVWRWPRLTSPRRPRKQSAAIKTKLCVNCAGGGMYQHRHHYTSLACCLSADSVRMGRIVKLM